MGLYNNRIVVKVGTSTLTNDAGKSDLRATDRLVCTLADIHNMGYEVILVDTSEYRKIDGGLSCLSLRFTAQK